MKKTIINLTAEPIILLRPSLFRGEVVGQDGKYNVQAEIPPSGQIARVDYSIVNDVSVDIDVGKPLAVNFPLRELQYRVVGLPKPKEGVLYFVDLPVFMVLMSLPPRRKDIITAGEVVKNEKGRVLGIKSFYTYY